LHQSPCRTLVAQFLVFSPSWPTLLSALPEKLGE
jgi:hypothetical protein